MSVPDLSTTYLGLELRSPWVAASSPLTGELDSMRRLEDAGAAAVVLPSLFQEQVEHEELELVRLHDTGANSHHEVAHYFPELESYNTGTEGTLRRIEEAREHLSIPVIASLNGISKEGWATHAKRMEAAGAHAIELNVFHLPTEADQSADDVEALYAEQVASVRSAVDVPIAVKIGAHLSAPVHTAHRLAAAGADGLVVFNRFLDPDIDLESLEVVPRLELSRASEMRMPLRWIAILDARCDLSLAATTGVHSSADAIKLLLVGADVVMVASALLLRGASFFATLGREVSEWLRENEYASVRQLKGSMNLANCPNPAGFERQSYMRALTSYSTPLA